MNREWLRLLSRLRRTDAWMLLLMFVLAGLGLLFIYSAQYVADTGAGGSMYRRQMLWLALGLMVWLAAALLDYRRLRRHWWWIYCGAMAMLVAVLLFGSVEQGARRWIGIEPFRVQPSEFAKLAVIAAVAAVLSHPGTDVRRPMTIVGVLALVGLPFLLVAGQPDLGTAMVFVPFTFAMLLIAGVPLRSLFVLLCVGLVFLPVGWFWLDDYQHERVLVFLDANRDPLGAGWNKIQSEIAVGSGGLTGKGWLKGTQNLLGFLPRSVAPTDFIYSVIAEEWGFAGAGGVLLLFAFLFYRCMRTALRTRDKLGRMLVVGVVSVLFGHVFVNIAMTVGLMPITGLPLPLLSYGGSFTISTMAALGLVQSVRSACPLQD